MAKKGGASSTAGSQSAAAGASTEANQVLGAVVDMLEKLSSGTVDSKTEDILKNLGQTSTSFRESKQATDFMGEEVAGFQTLMIPANMKQTYDLYQNISVAELTQRQKHQARMDILAEQQLANSVEVSKRISMMQNSQENKAFDHIWNLEPAEAKAIVAVLEALRGPEGAVLVEAIRKMLGGEEEA